MIILHIMISVIQFKNHAVVYHPLVTVCIKIAVEWCLYLVAGVTEMIWYCKCVCNTILKICCVVDYHLAHQEQCHSI